MNFYFTPANVAMNSGRKLFFCSLIHKKQHFRGQKPFFDGPIHQNGRFRGQKLFFVDRNCICVCVWIRLSDFAFPHYEFAVEMDLFGQALTAIYEVVVRYAVCDLLKEGLSYGCAFFAD